MPVISISSKVFDALDSILVAGVPLTDTDKSRLGLALIKRHVEINDDKNSLLALISLTKNDESLLKFLEPQK